ncbi:Ribosomal protein S18 acetylase RimI [Reichenbachiella faecimaris]|uniref:Ribosomal protein S18 acetylase RimI n=1 Tax=Reichenbachiella faecimaris TaxID=692418 RepID=A0A1W2GBU5_REIFA|nr:GNAT family N-acetyltransferase [Reichenbachiella faecimaris]SMD33942.1 Ribosomal protein S18 acetylase RimI [Reichenbachiella faecimaris]
MTPVTLRLATNADLPTLYEFEQGIIQAERPFDPTLKSGHINYYDLKALIASDHAKVIVAEVEGVVVASGYANIISAKEYLRHEKYAYLGFMFVDPKQRGKGIIKQILDELKLWSRSKGVNEIRLEVYEDNVPAVRAYEKAGFKKHMVKMRLSVNSEE